MTGAVCAGAPAPTAVDPRWLRPLMTQAALNSRIDPLDDAEIALLMKRGRAFKGMGMPSDIAAAWADRLALRDQEQETRVFCPECKSFTGSSCGNQQLFSTDRPQKAEPGSGFTEHQQLFSTDSLLNCHLYETKQ